MHVPGLSRRVAATVAATAAGCALAAGVAPAFAATYLDAQANKPQVARDPS